MNTIMQEEKYGVHVTATRREFLQVYAVLQETKNEKSTKFAAIVLKNLAVIEAALNPLEEMAKPSQEFLELSTKAQELIAAENEAGLKQLEEEHAELLQARRDQMEAVNKELDSEVTLELKMINEKLLPETLSAAQLETLIKIIN